MVRAHLIVNGIVQGVFFRAGTQRVATEHGVSGWVRNLHDGSVEAVLEGEEEAVKKVVEWSRRGPPGALVKKVQVDWEEYRGEFEGFVIR